MRTRGSRRHVFAAVDAAAAQPERAHLACLPAVVTLRAGWAQQYVQDARGDGGGWRWRAVDEMPPPGAMLSSPYAPAARYSRKGDATWVGYTVQLTETRGSTARRA